MNQKYKVILHSGTEKTGTTAIQNILAQEQKELLDNRILVPKSLCIGHTHLRLTMSCTDFNLKNPLLSILNIKNQSEHTSFIESTKKNFFQEIKKTNPELVLISDEHINVHLCTVNMLSRINDFFHPAAQINPVLFFRRQDYLLAAMISESLKCLSIEHYNIFDPIGNIPKGRYRFDYASILQNFSTVFGKLNLIVQSYEPKYNNDIVAQFSKCTEIPLHRYKNIQYINKSIPHNLIKPLWIIASELLAKNMRILKGEWRKFVEFLAKKIPGPAYKLTALESKHFMNRYHDSNSLIAKEYPALENLILSDENSSQEYNNADTGYTDFISIQNLGEEFLSTKAYEELRNIIVELNNKYRRSNKLLSNKNSVVITGNEMEWDAVCPICALSYRLSERRARREGSQCPNCGASGRASALLNMIARIAYDEEIPIKFQPPKKELRVVGLSDNPIYRELLQSRFNYTNTFYHQEPYLDIAAPSKKYLSNVDILISSEVFEHTVGNYMDSFYGAFSVLKSGGILILTVPYQNTGDHIEHYPDSISYRSFETSSGKWIAEINYKNGHKKKDYTAKFHGGPGNTLEMRVFSRKSIFQSLKLAGFSEVFFHDENRPEHGIFWGKPSRLITAVKR